MKAYDMILPLHELPENMFLRNSLLISILTSWNLVLLMSYIRSSKIMWWIKTLFSKTIGRDLSFNNIYYVNFIDYNRQYNETRLNQITNGFETKILVHSARYKFSLTEQHFIYKYQFIVRVLFQDVFFRLSNLINTYDFFNSY